MVTIDDTLLALAREARRGLIARAGSPTTRSAR
jgi:hypothetical protein